MFTSERLKAMISAGALGPTMVCEREGNGSGQQLARCNNLRVLSSVVLVES
jgi:hypothetical protein